MLTGGLAGSNTKAAQSTEGQRLTKIDRENEVAPPPKVDLSVGKAIAKARAEKTPPLKQSDLAQKINEKPSVINGMHLRRVAIADYRL
jgi:putative transcription factor